MESRNQVIHIPIKDYEDTMNTSLSRDKKEEITELLTNHCQILSQIKLNTNSMKNAKEAILS